MPPVSSCRSQPHRGGFGAEEEREAVSPGSGSGLLCVRQPEAAEQKHSLHSRPQHQEIPRQPEAPPVPAGGGAGRAVSPGATGETAQLHGDAARLLLSCNTALTFVILQIKIMHSKTLCAEKIP